MGVIRRDIQWVARPGAKGVKMAVRIPDIRYTAKKFFFDRKIVKDMMDKKTAQAMSQAGAFIRRRAQTSMRYRKAVSAPGTPPSAHRPRAYVRKYLWFSFDPMRRSLIVGPVKLNAVYWNHANEPITGPVPNVLEFGGKIRVLEVWKGVRRDWKGRYVAAGRQVQSTQGTWVRADLRKRKSRLLKRRTRLRTVTIKARPYMGPALVAEAPNIPKFWSASVRAA